MNSKSSRTASESDNRVRRRVHNLQLQITRIAMISLEFIILTLLRNQSGNPGIGLKKIWDFGIEKLTGTPGFWDPGIKTLGRNVGS